MLFIEDLFLFVVVFPMSPGTRALDGLLLSHTPIPALRSKDTEDLK